MKGLRSTTALGFLALAAAGLGLVGCAAKQETDAAAKPGTTEAPKLAAVAPPAPPKPPAPGLPVLDGNVAACDNFFLHACNIWKQNNPIPGDQSRWGSFSVLSEKNMTLVRGILDDAVKNPKPETEKIALYYQTCMDEEGVEAKGVAPLLPQLARIEALRDKRQLASLLGQIHDAGGRGFFAFGRTQKADDANQTIADIDQSGLGLPDRDFYFKDDAKSKEQRAAYLAHVAAMFKLAGATDEAAKAKADTVMALETKLAQTSMNRLERRDPKKLNNPTIFKTFAASMKNFDMQAYTKAVGAPALRDMNVRNPAYFKALDVLIKATPLDDIKTYLAWHSLRSAAPWLSKAFADENFNFYSRTLSGVKEQRPRWKRCVNAVDGALGEDLGRYFVEKAFGTEHKQRMLVMVGDIQTALGERIKQLDWMGPETKKRALEKLANMPNKIGYPDQWRDYSSLKVEKGDLLGNVSRASAFENRYDLGKIGKPRDKGEWGMTPPTVNAYYSPQQNNINFPAGILQPPFFDFGADDAYNYGAIGGVIGHEIIHGFDDQGRQFSADGNLDNWWTPDDEKRFNERAQCLIDQYSGFVAVEGVNLNGKQTLGENTADNGGISIALAALRNRMGPKMAEKVGGLTAEQRAFYGWAHVWCSQERPEARRLQALTGVHSLGEFRVNGTLSNQPEFAKAFNCAPGTAMNRGDKACKIW
jgi:putative endopeptidase